MKKILPVAVLAAMAGVNGAQAVHVNQDGLGQVLLFPYYTTTGGQDTYINLVNTTDEYKAVKVRILESLNSQEVLDFNLYLSPEDHWSAVIYADPDGEGAVIRSDDNSCTVPNAINEGAVVPFTNFLFTGDGRVNGLERTKEGYVEVIEMGIVFDGIDPDDEQWQDYILHDQPEGVPANCGKLSDAWSTGGLWIQGPTEANRDLSAPTGGLYGYGVLIDVQEGTAAGYDAVALDNFIDPMDPFADSVHTDPGDTTPNLGQSTNSYDVIIGNAVVSGVANNGFDAVSAVLMNNTISNDYVLESDIEGGTDWVITFPTKRDYVDSIPADAPFSQ
ncbi:MAG: hypothetical protein R3228_12500, partial [Halioglobus sp.]|nr:hypothetical protein [Halioglobus sp.]